MIKKHFEEAKLWQIKYSQKDYNPKLIFNDSKSKKDILFSLSFFLVMMAIEILFNQPFKKKIKLLHNNIYKKIFSKRFEKLERIEVNSFAFSLFLILQKLFEEEERFKSYSHDLIKNSINHWSCIEKVERDFLTRYQLVNNLWNENSKLVLSRTYDSRIDLIFLLYKSFELGISNKTIIKKNLSVLIFSVSKAQKDFRYDVLQEIKKKKIL